MDFNTGGKILGFKKRDVSAVGEKGDPVALWRQAVFLSRPVRWSATTAVLTGLRGSSKWDSFSCSLQTKCTCEPQQELGHLFWQLSPAVTGRGILIQREMAQHADESLTNATHRRVRLGKRKPPMAWINAQDSACSCEKPRRFGEAWPSKSIFIAVSALLLQPQVSASIPSSLAAGLSAVSLRSGGLGLETAHARSGVQTLRPQNMLRWKHKASFIMINEVAEAEGEKWNELCVAVSRFRRERRITQPLIPSHSTAAHSPGWLRWAGPAGTKTRWCYQQCG